MWSNQGWSAHLQCRNCYLSFCKDAFVHFLSQSALWGHLCDPANKPSGDLCVSRGDCRLTRQPQLESCSDPPLRNQALFSLLLVMSPMLEDNGECEQQKTTGTISLEAVGCVHSTWASGTSPLSSWSQKSWKMPVGAIQKYPHLQYLKIPLPQPRRKLHAVAIRMPRM